MTADVDAVAAVAAEICSYVAAHPEAADSVAGIHRWWLQPKFSAEHASVVEQALGRLVAAGVVRECFLPDGTSVYGSAERDPSVSRRRTPKGLDNDNE